ncbi:single-strand DNA-binding protein [Chryseobacterium takakiae]|jgi:single-strand DNA-binding protein|uniref:Single-stranded DNA-binding protein n=2 Tax=Chryseobacterium TaxID=59732 RepID=A0A1M5AAA5_9FLAO|nr:single-strand DNA-binding protein [Chryseobacterium takakiae]
MIFYIIRFQTTTNEFKQFGTDLDFSFPQSLQQRSGKTVNVPNLNINLNNNKIMSLRNKVTLIGYTGKEVEMVNFENGNSKAVVSLATSDYYTNAKGEKVEETQWHNLIAFGKTAEIFQKYVTKGKEIAIEGKLTYRSYDDKDGVKRYITEVRVDEILLLGGK